MAFYKKQFSEKFGVHYHVETMCTSSLQRNRKTGNPAETMRTHRLRTRAGAAVPE